VELPDLIGPAGSENFRFPAVSEFQIACHHGAGGRWRPIAPVDQRGDWNTPAHFCNRAHVVFVVVCDDRIIERRRSVRAHPGYVMHDPLCR
jgi:hypothetical protein